jgi:hypothetical protein
LFEPFFSKELIENQGYRDGMIISEDSVDKLGKPHLKVVHPNGYMELTDEQKKIYRFYEEVYQKGKLRNFYDVKQYAFLAAVVINTGNTFHHFGGFNLNLYVNPITGNLMPFLREIEFLPHEIPSLTSYEKVKKEFYQLSKIDRNNLKQFDLYSAYLDHFSYQLNKESIDSTILNNKELKSLYYYSNQYFPWSYAFKRRIRMPLEFKNKPILPTNSVENQEIVHKKEFSNGVFNLRNIVLAVNQLTVKNATLLFSGNVTRKGKDRIRIIGDSISTIIFENSRINLSNVEFIGFGNRIKIQNRAVTSAITFYNSDLQLNNVVFRDNYSGDDLVNIFRSKFAMNNVTFQNSKYDAIDVDFSNGVIRNCEIDKSGNDGLDFGGSQVIVHNTRVNNCGDKGISVGEKSTVQIFTSSITNSEIGFGLKDESLLRIRGIKLNNNHLDLAAYAKKGLFDSSTLDVLPKEFNSFRYLIEPGVTVKNNIVYTTTKQAKNQLYGKKYGKASVR